MNTTAGLEGEGPRFEVRIRQDGRTVHTATVDTLEEAEALTEEWTEARPGVQTEVKALGDHHDTWELIEDDTALTEDHPHST
jgi:hypothetical protein